MAITSNQTNTLPMNTEMILSASMMPKPIKGFVTTSHLLMVEAEKRGWRTEIIDYQTRLVAFFPDPDDFYRPRDPKKMIMCQRTTCELNTAHGRLIAWEKMAFYALANFYGFPIPDYLLYTPEKSDFTDQLSEFLRKYRRLVVKPTDCGCGDGVSTNITDMESFRTAVEYAKQYSPNILIQPYVTGDDYRIVVLNGHVIAAMWRRPAFIIGDGERTIRQLIEWRNKTLSHDKQAEESVYFTPLSEAEAYLGRERLESIPEKGYKIQVIGVANVSRGGESQDVTDIIHQSIRRMAEEISNAAQLGLCGVDFLIDGDITKPVGPDCKVVVIEINGQPGIALHHFPTSGGHPRNVAGAILDEIVRRRKLLARIDNVQSHDEDGVSDEKYFAPILSNPDEFLPLSQGEKNFILKIRR